MGLLFGGMFVYAKKMIRTPLSPLPSPIWQRGRIGGETGYIAGGVCRMNRREFGWEEKGRKRVSKCVGEEGDTKWEKEVSPPPKWS